MENKKISGMQSNDIKNMVLSYDKIPNVSRKASVLKENKQVPFWSADETAEGPLITFRNVSQRSDGNRSGYISQLKKENFK
jgi:hypothetical protein